MNVVEVNDNDIYGKIFNGYIIMEELNKKDKFNIKQLVINKFSNNSNCIRFFPSDLLVNIDFYIHQLEHDIMSTHSLLSISTLFLKNNNYYKKSDLAHFHQVHNCRFNLPLFFEMAKKKPTVISFHDPWFMTGRCVHPLSCDKWKTGCRNCEFLNTLFDLPDDNCLELWNIKKEISNTDIDIIVHSKFMHDMVKQNPYTKNLRVHEIPLGIDIKKYDFKLSKEAAKRKLNIFPSDTVIFFREQKELKGTNYIVEALKKLKDKSNITLLTCSQKGLLKEIQDDFNIIELGTIEEKDVLLCYNAADMFLMPSLGESFGMMAVEAMASGLPTIVFDNSALPSTTGAPNVGILVKNLDSNDLYSKIKYYLDNPKERIKRGKISKKYVSKKYDYETYFKKIEDVYNKSYEKQKYKLNKKYIKKTDINYDDKFVISVSKKLISIYKKMYPNYKKPNFLFDKPQKTNQNKIMYSNPDVLKIIEKFNERVYDMQTKKTKNIVQTNNQNVIYNPHKNDNPKVSIIIPVYNGGKYVSLAIDSALRQTYNNIEIIVVNDGSTDNTDKICKSYGNKIKYIKKENGGVSTALNVGIKNMTGDYFSWLSHDDLYYPEKILTEIEYLRKNNLFGTKTILYSNFSIIDGSGKLINDIIFDNIDLNKDSAFSVLKGGINGLTLLIPKKAFKDAGLFDKNLRCVQDYKLWFDMYLQGYKFSHIPNVLTATRIHQESVTNTSPKVVTEGNEFWINVIKHFSDSEKQKLYGSIYNYYYSLYNFFNGGPYDKAKELCEKKFMGIERKVKKVAENTRVSIVIPFSNNINSTIRALKSVMNQTHKKIEIILINNGSTDDISNVKKIINQHNNIKYIDYKTKQSISIVLNEGIKKASGKYISILKSNSIFDNKKIETQLIKMISSGSVISHTSYYSNVNNVSNFIDSAYQHGFVRHNIIDNCEINISTIMCNKDYIVNNKIYFNEKLKYGSDVCFYLDILKSNDLLGIRLPLTTSYDININKNKNYEILSIINYLISHEDLSEYNEHIVESLKKYISIYDNDNNYKKEHQLELERYEYMQTDEYINVQKIRNLRDRLLFRKNYKINNLTKEELKYSRLNRYYRYLKNLKARK